MGAGKKWSREDLQLLYELSSEYPPHQIAKKIGRTTSSVISMQGKKKIQGFCLANAKYISYRTLAIILQANHSTVLKWANKLFA